MNPIPPRQYAQIKKAIKIAKVNFWLEKRWPILAFVLALWLFYICLGLLGIPQQFSDLIRVLILVLFAGISIGGIFYYSRNLPSISFKDIIKRLEKVNRLSSNPLYTIHDSPIIAQSQSTWDIHLQRVYNDLPPLKTGLPKLLFQKPYLNCALGVLLIGCGGLVVYNGNHASSRLVSAFRPGYDDTTMPLATLQAWIISPPYSHRAPVYLKSDNKSVTFDQYARLHVAVSGLSHPPELIDSNHTILKDRSIQKLDPTHWQVEGTLHHSGTITVKARGRTLAQWDLTMPANDPPTITWTAPIKTDKSNWKTVFPFKVAQRYGVKSVQLDIDIPKTQDHEAIHLLSVPLGLGDHPKTIEQKQYHDLSSTIWPGEHAMATLKATDVTGQTTTSPAQSFILPKRQFSSPVAQQINLARQQYGKQQLTKEEIINALSNLQDQPDITKDYDLFLNYVAIIYFLNYSDQQTQAVQQEALSRLWDLILDIEERNNSNSDIARANTEIRAAQASVQEQIQKMQQLGKDKITQQDKQELDARLQRLQNAIAQKMVALTKQTPTKQQESLDLSKAQFISVHAFEDMFKDINKTIREGDINKISQQLEDANNALNTLRQATPEDLKQLSEHIKSQEHLQKLTKALEELIKKQQLLLDQSHIRLNQAAPIILRPGEDLSQLSTPQLMKEIGADKGKSTQSTTQTTQQSAENQRILNQALRELHRQFQQESKQPIENLSKAEQEMEDAYQALTQKDDTKAAKYQEQALIDLQKGNQSIKQGMKQEAKKFSNFFPVLTVGKNQSKPSSSDNSGSSDKKTDPLGRPVENENANIDLTGNKSNARAIEEELRKRADDPNRSEKELDYIYRLLNMF
ncbi:DUF4175 family protein [Commensalibacter oyaizuii]|uniref:DUF4175 family protein n=1 Tax=Commensalibacter oyaizuii TaxID=3043873 RepID=A0ABT6PZ31_9PROT|nr:DUF4175 family protein [Commensalibacter sp. TBRC 16381]MDI2090112.1 DUF4175 family protein [Commensalibacter sp. TBRC 16381]